MSAREPIGWPLLPLPDESGRLAWPTLDQSVREAIRVILSTRPGEQLMRPRFGGGLSELLQEPDTLTTRRRIRDRVEEALSRWEDRLSLEHVDVTSAEDLPGEVRVAVVYRLKRTGEARSLNLTLQLERV